MWIYNVHEPFPPPPPQRPPPKPLSLPPFPLFSSSMLSSVWGSYIMVILDRNCTGGPSLQEVVWGAAGHVRLPSARRGIKLQAGWRKRNCWSHTCNCRAGRTPESEKCCSCSGARTVSSSAPYHHKVAQLQRGTTPPENHWPWLKMDTEERRGGWREMWAK